jgi:hypothetical protein
MSTTTTTTSYNTNPPPTKRMRTTYEEKAVEKFMRNEPVCKCGLPCIQAERYKDFKIYYTCEIRKNNYNSQVPKNSLPGCDYFCWKDDYDSKKEKHFSQPGKFQAPTHIQNFRHISLKKGQDFMNTYTDLVKTLESVEVDIDCEIPEKIIQIEKDINIIKEILSKLIKTELPVIVTEIFSIKENQ